MRKSNFALRLQPSLMEEARKVAEAEGVAVNQLINVAVAEKLSALRTQEYFNQRAARGSVAKALRILKRVGTGTPPVPGDELPPNSRKSAKARPPRRTRRVRLNETHDTRERSETDRNGPKHGR